MTNDELDRLEALAGAATAGPWAVEELPESGDPWWVLGPEVDGSSTLVGIHQHRDDANFCAKAREAVPRLVAEVRMLTRERDEAMQIADKWAARAEQLVGLLEKVAQRIAK